MKTKQSKPALILIMLLLISCSNDDSNPVLDIFIPNLSNQWVSDRPSNSSFFFTADDPGKNESTFTGSEQDANANSNFQLVGKYKNYDVEFTFTEGDENGVKYTGKFIKGSNPLTMVVTSTTNVKITITQKL